MEQESANVPTPVWQDPRVERGMRRQLEGVSESPAGWKLGLGSKAAMEAAGISGPLVGYLTAATALDNGAVVDIASSTNVLAEPEIAVFLGETVGPEATGDEIAAAITGLAAAIEVVDIDLPLTEVEEALAGDVFHSSYMLGETVTARAGADTEGLDLRVLIDGEETAHVTDPEAFIGKLVDLTSFTAQYLASCGQTLAAGQFIITGSIMPPIPVAPGKELTYAAGDLGELRVTFTG